MNDITLLVSNIQFKSDDKQQPNIFDCNIPLEYSEHGCLAQHYLRAYVFNELNVDFTFTIIDRDTMIKSYSTAANVEFDYIVDLVDFMYEKTQAATVSIMYPTSYIVHVDTTDAAYTDGSEQAIFERLLYTLPMSFFITNK